MRQREGISRALKVRPYFRFLPDTQRVDALRDEAKNLWLFKAFLDGRPQRPWLKQPCALFKVAEKGQVECARAIVELACQASLWVCSLESSNPEMMSAIARQRAIWPVLGSYDSSWDKDILARLAVLGLGLGRQDVLPRFREAQGDEEKLPARRWARAAVLCVISTRAMQRKLSQLDKQEAEILRQGRLQIEAAPAWASKTSELPDYGDGTRPTWGRFIRTVIRQQIPDFHLRPEWKSARCACQAKTANKKLASKGDLQNAILDDIVTALKTITAKEIAAA